MVILSLIFWGNFTLFSIVVIPIYFLTNSSKEFSFLHILANICCLSVDGHSNNVRKYCGLDWISLVIAVFTHFFIYPLAICMSSWKKLVRVLCSLSNWVWRILLLNDMSSLYIADSSPLSDLQLSNLFSNSLVASSLYSLFLLLCRFLDWCCSIYFCFVVYYIQKFIAKTNDK